MVATLNPSGLILRVESKKGPLNGSKSSKEYPLLREAIGQIITINDYDEKKEILAVAVPNSKKFESLAEQWRDRPLVKQTGLKILTVDRKNKIHGLDIPA